MLVFAGSAIILFGAISAYVLEPPFLDFIPGFGKLDYEQSRGKLSGLLSDVDYAEDFVRGTPTLQGSKKADIAATLPRIDRFAMVVNPPGRGSVKTAEIFVSTEKSGSGTDGWMVEVATAFNARDHRLPSGRTGKIAIRKIASGTGFQFIASGKHRPQGFSPSNHMWVRMAEAHGVKMTPIGERMVGNIAGIVMTTEVADRIRAAQGDVDVSSVIDAVVQGNLVMGYTNPFASSTGLNFLVTVLATFAAGDPERMLDPEVVSAFESFQEGVPFVAMTTLQMRESVEQGGSLEAFVMEYQTFIKTPVLQSGYEFIPFGIRHDNPLYGVGELDEDTSELLFAFAAFAGTQPYARLARDYGFDPEITYDPVFDAPPGELLVRAQKLWKEKKDAGRPVAAVFLADVSGSMRGGRLSRLKKALAAGSEFISSGNSIGLVVFSNDVRVLLPIKRFDPIHKASFSTAVRAMNAAGSTAMYDGIAVSLSMLVEEKNRNANAKPILFVLSDGETNAGLSFNRLRKVIQGLNIPVYTIGYEANLEELGRVSSLVEAASINAGEGEISYKIGTMLNAQM